MAGDTALLFTLTYTSDRAAIAEAARDALAFVPESPWEAAFILRQLATKDVGMPGSGEGIALVGTVSKGPDVDALIASLRPALTEIFRTQSSARALLWTEAYEASDPGACVDEVFWNDEETTDRGELQTRHHVVELALRTYAQEPPGSARPHGMSRARHATSIVLMFGCDDEGAIASSARAAAEAVRQGGGKSPARDLALEYLEDLSTRGHTQEFVGPKGGLSVWGRKKRTPFDATELIELITPFVHEVTDDLSGAIVLFQTKDDAASGCRIGLFDVEDTGESELFVRYHDLPFGLGWAPALLVR